LLDRPESGGTMLLGCLNVDLNDLRQRVAATAPVADAHAVKPDNSGTSDDLMLPSGDLNRALFDEAARAALDEAALLAFRTYWADLRSPHLFLGILGRRNSRLAEHLTAQRLVDPHVLSSAFLSSLTNRVNAALRQPKLHREFLSENALFTLRAAHRRAQQAGRAMVAERDILASILDNESNIITTALRQAGVDPQRLLWPDV
jgi:hypothetical protein